MNQALRPPFDAQTAAQKVRRAEDSWNSCDPGMVVLGYTPDSEWRNRTEFLAGRAAIVKFLTRKWTEELEYRLIKGTVGIYGQSHRRALRL